MKVDRIIFGLNKNPVYTSFWNIFAPIWVKKYNIIPTLIFVGTEEEMNSCNLSTSFGEIIRLDPVEEVVVNKNLDWSVTWALFWGASMFPNEICMTSGIDQLMLSDKFIKLLEPISDEKYVIGFADAYDDKDFYPSSHNVAKDKTFKHIFEIEDEWSKEVKKVFDAVKSGKFPEKSINLMWGLDECYASDKIVQYEESFSEKLEDSNIIYFEIFRNYWKNSRIDRDGINISYNKDWLKSGRYSELHSPRPYEKYKQYIDNLIKDFMD